MTLVFGGCARGAGRRPRATARPGDTAPAARVSSEPAPAASEDPMTIDANLEHAPRRPDELVTLSLENADLSDLVRTMSEMTGKRFVVAAAPEDLPGDRRLAAKGHRCRGVPGLPDHPRRQPPHRWCPRGRFLKIIDAQDAVHEAPVRSTKEGVVPEERYVTYVHRVSHVPGDEMAAVLAKLASHDGAIVPYGNVLLLTDTGANVQRMMRVLDELDVAQAEDKVWLEPLQYVAVGRREERARRAASIPRRPRRTNRRLGARGGRCARDEARRARPPERAPRRGIAGRLRAPPRAPSRDRRADAERGADARRHARARRRQEDRRSDQRGRLGGSGTWSREGPRPGPTPLRTRRAFWRPRSR